MLAAIININPIKLLHNTKWSIHTLNHFTDFVTDSYSKIPLERENSKIFKTKQLNLLQFSEDLKETEHSKHRRNAILQIVTNIPKVRCQGWGKKCNWNQNSKQQWVYTNAVPTWFSRKNALIYEHCCNVHY